MKKLNVLNLGCGTNPLKEDSKYIYTNVDMLDLEGVVKHNLTSVPYPFGPAQFDLVYMFHCIEHIPESSHISLLHEIRRLLKPKGRAAFSYPEFTKCAMNYIKNYRGEREFWKATLYGRGLTEWDRHIALMDTRFFIERLKECGLIPIKVHPEKRENYNTVVICEVGAVPLTYEQLLGKEFGVINT